MTRKPGRSAEGGIRRAWLFPKTLSTALDHPTRQSLLRRGFGEKNLVRDWARIVGAELARHSFPLKLNAAHGNAEACLVIRAESGSALHIQHLEPQILERITIYYGYPVARRIAIVQ